MQDQIYLGYLASEVNALLWLPSQVPFNELTSGSIDTRVPPNRRQHWRCVETEAHTPYIVWQGALQWKHATWPLGVGNKKEKIMQPVVIMNVLKKVAVVACCIAHKA